MPVWASEKRTLLIFAEISNVPFPSSPCSPRQHRCTILQLQRAYFIFLLSLAAGCHPAARPSPATASAPVTPASWFSLGGETHDVEDIDPAEKLPLAFDPQPQWFLLMDPMPPALNVNDGHFDTVTQPTRQSLGSPDASEYRLPYPKSPRDLPLEDRGVRLNFEAATTNDPSLLQFSIALSAADAPVWRETEHRWTNIVPLLFCFYVDRKPVTRELGWYGKVGGIQNYIVAVAAHRTRNWAFHVQEASVRQFLPDAKPHRVVILCAFSETQHEWYASALDYSFMYATNEITPPTRHRGAQVLVRSNAVDLDWDGTKWISRGKG
jgi:hypothetical protein